jgi:hypothetical protein
LWHPGPVPRGGHSCDQDSLPRPGNRRFPRRSLRRLPPPKRRRHRVIVPVRLGVDAKSQFPAQLRRYRRPRRREVPLVGRQGTPALCDRYPSMPEHLRKPSTTARVWYRRSSALGAPRPHVLLWLWGRVARGCADRSPPRAHRPRVRARPVLTPGGRSSDPTSGRSLLKVAPASGAGGNPRAAPPGVSSPARSDRLPRLNARTRSFSSRSRDPANDWETVRSEIAKTTEQVTATTAIETAVTTDLDCVKAPVVVILSSSLVVHLVRPVPRVDDSDPARGPVV